MKSMLNLNFMGVISLIAAMTMTMPSSPAFGASPFCTTLGHHFDREIRPKIEKGIPFDVVFLFREAKRGTCKTVVNLRYDLWQETVRSNKNGVSSPPQSMEKARQHLCEIAVCEGLKSESAGRAVQVKVLLNPLWDGASKHLIRTKQNSMIRFFKLEWDELSQELPKDLEIINEEVVL